ncbi:enoyl-CoA hydratase/carnithine racemase [Nocardioides aromaticivorans]|uniref:Enoyl-CoA hydratase/carnithine racemase n=1 Tax=Nocardioides aromaticivorans TaxID=200618 RepID=A0A7Y9ZGU0_9ACTN|nr:enoyl-CoA hydratase-related protein [Nocardioides aromaticivorans]NYI44003.1 enoyl-CoA hydratase/carnithine racemase [Nocardioides aromaticivorans]
MTTLDITDGIAVLTIGDDENRFTLAWLDEVEAALDRVVEAGTPLVTTGGGKFFSNGLDLDWAMANPEEFGGYAQRVERLLARFLALPVPTVAAVNGHAFGAGAMLALAHDWRVMRADRGFFCLPEVDIRIPFTPGMAALIQARLTPRSAVDAMTTGARFGGPEAEAAGIVDATAAEEGLLADAVARVAPLQGKDVATLESIKSTMFAPVLELLRGTSA